MKSTLKQPSKYIDLKGKKSDVEIHSSENSNEQPKSQTSKTKQISKSAYTKRQIKKKHQPSAIRHKRINQTFYNIHKNSDKIFEDLNLNSDSLQALASVKQKGKCKCNKNVKYYCLQCMTKVTSLEFPSVELPLSVQVIHHQSEKVNKSSALPLKFLSEQISCHFYSSASHKTNDELWGSLPKPQETFILFPHKNSKSIADVDIQKVSNLMVLDCTWFQTDLLIDQLSARGYQNYIRLQPRQSIYWRYNHHGQEALSSVEALTYFMRQRQRKVINQNTKQIESQKQPQQPVFKQAQSSKAQKKFDNLMFLYALNLKLIIKEAETKRQSKENNLANGSV